MAWLECVGRMGRHKYLHHGFIGGSLGAEHPERSAAVVHIEREQSPMRVGGLAVGQDKGCVRGGIPLDGRCEDIDRFAYHSMCVEGGERVDI